MILLTGATGQLGTAVLERLLQKLPATQLVGLVRNEQKAADLTAKGVHIRLGDYDNIDSLDQAMQGIHKVLLIAGGDSENALQQHKNVVDAAKRAQVGGIAYTGRSLRDPSSLVNQLMVRHFQTEEYIRASGLPYVLFRNILYMDAIPRFVGPTVLDTGISLPAGEGKVAFALRSDMGEAIANVLADSTCDNRIYNFTGDRAYSFDDVAATLTSLSGKPVTYTPIEPAAFESRMKQRGLPESMIERMIGFITDIKNGQESDVSTDLETILGRKPTSLYEGLKLLYQL